MSATNSQKSTKVKIQLFTDHRDPADQLALDGELRKILNRIGNRIVCVGLSYTDHHGKIRSIPEIGEKIVLICKIGEPDNIVQGNCYTPCGPVSLERSEL